VSPRSGSRSIARVPRDRLLAPLLAALLLALGGSCRTAGTHISLRNESGVPLEHYALRQEVAGAWREPTGRRVAPGERFDLDLEEARPMLFDPLSMLSITVVTDWRPYLPMVRVLIFRHLVPPGQEGDDPRRAPRLHSELDFEVELTSPHARVDLRVGEAGDGLPVVFRQL
jgi:hypothetical protein